jgi:epidermal growth factor receptor substrate 15
MHLVYKALEKYTIPNMLPPELMPPSKRKDSVQAAALPGAVPVLPNLVMGIDGTKVRQCHDSCAAVKELLRVCIK